MIKKLSLKGLADYMTASPTRQRKILRDYKYPSEDEARAKILYYRDARDRIVAFHESSLDPQWLRDQADELDAMATASPKLRAARQRHNARGLRLYAKHFGSRDFKVLDEFSWDLQFGDVFVSVYPDLHVRERNSEKVIKLEFSKDEPDDNTVKILAQCLFEAASSAGLGLTSASVLVFDVPRGKVHKGARMGSRMAGDIEATCKNISAIWDAI